MSGTAAEQPPASTDPDVPLPASHREGTTEMDKMSAGNIVLDAVQIDATRHPICNPELHATPHRPTHPTTTETSNSQPQVFTIPSSNVDNTSPMPNPNAQISIIQTWMDVVPEIASQRDLILTERMDVKQEKTLYYQHEEHLVNIMDAFLALVDVASKHGSYLQHQDELNDFLNKMKDLRQNLNSLRQRRSDMEDRLSSHEYTLTKLEQKVYHQIDSEWRPGLKEQTPHLSQSSTPPERPHEAPQGSTSQNFRDELYSRMADVRILLDRLHEFEDYLRQELDERAILRATGQILVSDDAVFFEEVRNEREKLQTDFEEAQADVERLKQQCIRQGIDFQDVCFQDPFQQETFDDDTYSTVSTREEPAAVFLPESPSGILGTLLATRERVKNWLKHPSSPDVLLTGTAEREGEDRARTESRSDADWVIPCGRRSWPRYGRPASLVSCAGDDKAQYGVPMQASGAPVSSELMEALLKDSMREPTGNIRKHKRLRHATV